MASTNVIRKIAFGAAAEQALPTLPALNGEIDWSALAATWPYVLGSIEDGDLGDLDEDDIDCEEREETLEVDPPLRQNREDEIIFKNGSDMFSFATYTYKGEILALDSTATRATGVTQKTKVATRRACIIEIAGIGVDYYPSVRIKVVGRPGGIKKLSKVNFECKVFGTETVPAGMLHKEFGT